MKISELIQVLEDVKKYHGDKYIWSVDGLDFPCPRSFELELTSKLKKTDMGHMGGKADKSKTIEVDIEYEGGVKVEDRSIREKLK